MIENVRHVSPLTTRNVKRQGLTLWSQFVPVARIRRLAIVVIIIYNCTEARVALPVMKDF